MIKTAERVRRVIYEENFNIDISQEDMAQVFEVISLDRHKFKVEVVDPRKHKVRVTSKGNEGLEDFAVEGQMTVGKGRRSNLSPYASLPAPRDNKCALMVAKMRRL